MGGFVHRWCFKCRDSFEADETPCPRCSEPFAQVVAGDSKAASGSVPVVKFGFISAGELTRFLSKEYRVPEIDLDEWDLSPDILALVPAELAQKHKIIPVNRPGASLIIAMIDPSDSTTIDLVHN